MADFNIDPGPSILTDQALKDRLDVKDGNSPDWKAAFAEAVSRFEKKRKEARQNKSLFTPGDRNKI